MGDINGGRPRFLPFDRLDLLSFHTRKISCHSRETEGSVSFQSSSQLHGSSLCHLFGIGTEYPGKGEPEKEKITRCYYCACSGLHCRSTPSGTFHLMCNRHSATDLVWLTEDTCRDPGDSRR